LAKTTGPNGLGATIALDQSEIKVELDEIKYRTHLMRSGNDNHLRVINPDDDHLSLGSQGQPKMQFMFRISKEGIIHIEKPMATGPVNFSGRKTPDANDLLPLDPDASPEAKEQPIDLQLVLDENGEAIIPCMIDEDTPEAAAARAFKTLAKILQ
jgi:hypothetical protein